MYTPLAAWEWLWSRISSAYCTLVQYIVFGIHFPPCMRVGNKSPGSPNSVRNMGGVLACWMDGFDSMHACRSDSSQLTVHIIWYKESNRRQASLVLQTKNFFAKTLPSRGRFISQRLSLTLATTAASARPLEIVMAISYGLVLPLTPSMTLPSGRVTLMGSSDSAACSAARLAFTLSNTWSQRNSEHLKHPSFFRETKQQRVPILVKMVLLQEQATRLFCHSTDLETVLDESRILARLVRRPLRNSRHQALLFRKHSQNHVTIATMQESRFQANKDWNRISNNK